ncbi:MAG: XRE family transcriptional regulator [Cyanobacteria bacterium J069]|nr:MAG: XRE family transcriptional regulator [Cyanobacteria bacterium J069]
MFNSGKWVCQIGALIPPVQRAIAIDVTVQTVSNWETGRYKDVRLTLVQVKALCRLLRWTLDDLPDDFGAGK